MCVLLFCNQTRVPHLFPKQFNRVVQCSTRRLPASIFNLQTLTRKFKTFVFYTIFKQNMRSAFSTLSQLACFAHCSAHPPTLHTSSICPPRRSPPAPSFHLPPHPPSSTHPRPPHHKLYFINFIKN